MCFHRRSYYRDENVEEVRGRRLWDLFHRETKASEPPLPVLEHDDELSVTEREREEATAGAER
jgi:hypothetical protein